MTFRDVFFVILGMNIGVLVVFGSVWARWSLAHALVLFRDLAEWSKRHPPPTTQHERTDQK